MFDIDELIEFGAAAVAIVLGVALAFGIMFGLIKLLVILGA